MSTPPAESVSYKEVKGFGKGIPLAMAMNQIVPSDYAYTFAPEINPGTSVNWQGDRPWNVVLSDALAPAGLVAVIDNNSVRIQPASGSAAPRQRLRRPMQLRSTIRRNSWRPSA